MKVAAGSCWRLQHMTSPTAPVEVIQRWRYKHSVLCVAWRSQHQMDTGQSSQGPCTMAKSATRLTLLWQQCECHSRQRIAVITIRSSMLSSSSTHHQAMTFADQARRFSRCMANGARHGVCLLSLCALPHTRSACCLKRGGLRWLMSSPVWICSRTTSEGLTGMSNCHWRMKKHVPKPSTVLGVCRPSLSPSATFCHRHKARRSNKWRRSASQRSWPSNTKSKRRKKRRKQVGFPFPQLKRSGQRRLEKPLMLLFLRRVRRLLQLKLPLMAKVTFLVWLKEELEPRQILKLVELLSGRPCRCSMTRQGISRASSTRVGFAWELVQWKESRSTWRARLSLTAARLHLPWPRIWSREPSTFPPSARMVSVHGSSRTLTSTRVCRRSDGRCFSGPLSTTLSRSSALGSVWPERQRSCESWS
mmetsp:Transcript_86674/g.153391  ORF Transcript_86674/g.153391 Transcript_86674/m.153391 type:complete len:418 (-) Transcript_86674:212-1465(-)